MALKVTVVGCGAVAQRLYRRPLQQLEKRDIVRVTGLVDTDRGRRDEMLAAFPHAVSSDDLEGTLSAAGSELALVLTPGHLHGIQTVAAVSHGHHVLCEKPMATTEADAAQMRTAAEQAGRVLGIGMVRRFLPAFLELKEWVDAGRIGRVERVEYREGHRFDWDITTADAFRRRGIDGGGVLSDIGPHALDLLIWLLGPLTVRSCRDDALEGGEANVVLDIDAAGCSGIVQLSWDVPLANELRLFGSRGEAVLRLDQFDQLAIRTGDEYEAVTSARTYPADLASPPGKRLCPTLYTQAIFCQLIQMVRAIRLGEAPAVGADVGEQCTAVIAAARRLARPLPMPWLDEARARAFEARHWSRV